MKKITNRIGISLIIVIFFAALANAQGPTDPNVPCDVTDPLATDCPLDNGVIALLAAGAFLGIKKLAVK